MATDFQNANHEGKMIVAKLLGLNHKRKADPKATFSPLLLIEFGKSLRLITIPVKLHSAFGSALEIFNDCALTKSASKPSAN